MRLLRLLLWSLKWNVAGKEMEELYYLKMALKDAQKHLGHFPDAAQALDYVRVMGERSPLELPIDIHQLKNRMEHQRVDMLRAIHTFRTTA